jgi:hypothetical protein
MLPAADAQSPNSQKEYEAQYPVRSETSNRSRINISIVEMAAVWQQRTTITITIQNYPQNFSVSGSTAEQRDNLLP